MDDREHDIAVLEIMLKNDKLEQEWRLHKLGIRARYLDAETESTMERNEGFSTEDYAETPYAAHKRQRF